MDSSHDDCEPRWVLPDRVLSEETDRQLVDARQLLTDLQVELASVPATGPDAATLADSVRQLDELFLLVASSTPARARSSMPCSAVACSTRA